MYRVKTFVKSKIELWFDESLMHFWQFLRKNGKNKGPLWYHHERILHNSWNEVWLYTQALDYSTLLKREELWRGPEFYAHALKQIVLYRLNDMEAAAASCCWTRSRHFLVQIVRSWWYHKGPCFFRQSNKNGQNSANFRQIKVRSLFSRNFNSRRFQTFFFGLKPSRYKCLCMFMCAVDTLV